MDKSFSISIYLDTRRAKKDGTYPVKLRVFSNNPRKQKLFNTKFSFTEKDFNAIWESKKVRKEYRQVRLSLQALENSANKIADSLTEFSMEAFERKILSKKPGDVDVVSYYEQIIEQFKTNGQISTANSYRLSLNSLFDYHKKERLRFQEVTPQWLQGYKKHMVDDKDRSITTVSIYLRALRAVFNKALNDGFINTEIYPFGRRKFEIPNPKSVKKALTKDQLRTLYDAKPQTPEQEKAKAFWFFSYLCNGMNFKDIANLKYRDISDDKLVYRRAKTSNTSTEQAPVTIYLNDFTKKVIGDYGSADKVDNGLIFSIIAKKETPEENYRKVKNFVRFVNQHFLKFAKSAGITEMVSTYWARHSFATNAIRSGASMEFVSEALSHSSLKTTRSYFAGFEDEEKKKIAKRLMEF